MCPSRAVASFVPFYITGRCVFLPHVPSSHRALSAIRDFCTPFALRGLVHFLLSVYYVPWVQLVPCVSYLPYLFYVPSVPMCLAWPCALLSLCTLHALRDFHVLRFLCVLRAFVVLLTLNKNTLRFLVRPVTRQQGWRDMGKLQYVFF